MERLFVISLSALLTFCSCHKAIVKKTPSCITGKINDFHDDACSVGANVKKYIFQNASVFVFDPGMCGADMTSAVLDANCNALGHLGGITGNTSINGEDFGNAELQETIWTN